MPNSDKPAILVEELTVSYTVKDLLAQINDRVVGIDTKLDTKASVEYVKNVEEKLETRVDGLDSRVGILETSKAKIIGATAVVGFLAGGGGIALGQILMTP